MRRTAVVILLALAALGIGLTPVEAARNPRPSVEIVGVTGTQPGPEGELDHVLQIDAHDPDGIITEVVVQFGDGSVAFAHTFCFIFAPGEVAHMQIGNHYETPGTYVVRAWATSVPECSEYGFEHAQESHPDVERVAIQF